MQDANYTLHAALEQRHWWFVARMGIVRRVIDAILAPVADPQIIDVGCGTGGTVHALAPHYRILGLDSSELSIKLARDAFPDATFICGTMPSDLEAPARETSLFLLMDVLEHIEEDRKFLADLVSIAPVGSKILITVPARKCLWSQHDVSAEHVRRYEAEELAQLWTGLDVTPKLLTFFNARLYPLIWLARQVGNRLGRSSGADNTDFFLPPAPLNWTLTRIFGGEAGRVLGGLNAPEQRPYKMGVSLMAVLEKTGGRATAKGE